MAQSEKAAAARPAPDLTMLRLTSRPNRTDASPIMPRNTRTHRRTGKAFNPEYARSLGID